MKSKVNIKEQENVINFEIPRKKYRLGKSDVYIEIDTGDVNIPVRFKEATTEIEKYTASLKDKYGITSLDDVGKINTGDISSDIAAIKEVDLFFKEKINYIFNYDVSKFAFGNASCISVTPSGFYYYESFLNAIIPAIEKEFDVRIKKLSARANDILKNKGKYTR